METDPQRGKSRRPDAPDRLESRRRWLMFLRGAVLVVCLLIGSTAGVSGVLLNINSASLQELDSLPRVGPVIAQRIIDWREDHGRFSVSQQFW